MKVTHDCQLKSIKLPENVQRLDYRERCSECGQVWNIVRRRGVWSGTRDVAFFINIKLYRWRRRMKKELI